MEAGCPQAARPQPATLSILAPEGMSAEARQRRRRPGEPPLAPIQAKAFGALFFGVTVLAATVFPSCARVGFPEGGPVDDKPPAMVSTIPENHAIDVPADVQIEILFDEPLAPGVQAQARRLVLVNPDQPEVVTNSGGKKVEIQPREPLEANTTYSVVVLPGLPDRRSNLTKEPVQLAFSTGGPLTLTLLKGTVTAGGAPARGASVYALNQDRKFGYRAFTDSSGTFELQSVALGSYEVTAWAEGNGEEGFQFTLEPGDSAVGKVEKLGGALDVALDLVQADTSAPRLVRAEPLARDGLSAVFTDSLLREEPLDPAKAELLGLPSDVAPRGTPLDSIPQSAVRGDTVPVVEVRFDAANARGVVLLLGAELADSTAYALRIEGVRNAAGLTAPEDPPFLLFRTRAVPDSTLAPPPDTTVAPGAGGVVAPVADTLPVAPLEAPPVVPGDTLTPATPADTAAPPPPDTTAAQPADTTAFEKDHRTGAMTLSLASSWFRRAILVRGRR
jgi:hypothetical protein